MNARTALVAALFAMSPYIISRYFIFIFAVPTLALFYSGLPVRNSRLLLFSFLLACAILLPIVAYNPLIYVFGLALLTLFITTFTVAGKALIQRLENPFLAISGPAALWTSLIYLLNFKSLGKAALDIGVFVPTLAPPVWYIGSIGVTTLLILFNAALARFWAKKDKFSLSVASILFVIFSGSFIFSVMRNPGYLHVSEEPTKVALIQGDVPKKSFLGSEENLDERIARYVDLSVGALERDKQDMVVWPEYTLPIDLMNRFPKKMEPILRAVKNSNTVFIIGSLLSGEIQEKAAYNTAIIFDREGKLDKTYYSEEPTPFTPKIRRGKNTEKLYLNQAGITLCWEELNDRIFRNYVQSGAEYFISLSSNADFDFSWFKKYISFFSRARAAENMRYLARVTQTGVTQIVNPFGKIVKKIPSNYSGSLLGDVYSIRGKTFYSLYGDILTKIFVGSIAFLIFFDVKTALRTGAVRKAVVTGELKK